MSEVLDPANLGFKIAAGLGEDNPLLRGVVMLNRRYDVNADDRPGFAREARQLSASMFHSVLIAAVDAEKRWQPVVASVFSSDGLGEGLRQTLELESILVDPDYADPDVLAGVMIALSCRGRNRLRPIAANVNPAHESTVGVLEKLGFQKDEKSSGIDFFDDTPPEDRYVLSAGHLAVHRASRLPGGREMLKQARQSLNWA